jgi:DNA-binding NarL/FixJ family response regulator
MIRERIATLLDILIGVEVVGQAGDAECGLKLIKELHPDVLVLDIGLPGQSGIELLQTVKQLQPCPVVIMLTNYTEPKLREKCMELGADYYFQKPAEIEKAFYVCQKMADLRDLRK